ncbi:beta-ketoacyl reductase [Cryptococcus wingfieldii CBS 7118]|uniref:Beta-ketoacyl reductase n=1 Tax=Cryptococcus wingfieldii CBS 7118 TaxID=1295528 RepID=A0A1E3J327_9TREE|nr:beta-ketoacyl reductase [Cryptococcus wingfieldii CBS 7118]ODN95247.1 beta-ketoacyl reductase [Cryptococcus wingfieldii CBS 7118]
MPVTVLLTGLNGFVAVHTAVTFLSQGSKVIGTVRSEDKKAKAEGRYLIAGEDYTLKQILDTTRKVQPDLQKYFNRARESVPPEASYVIDSSKNGLRYRTLEETIRDSVAGFEKLCAYGGSVILVTGGGRGVGEMIAEGYVVNGAKVVYISSRDAAACEQTAKRLTNQGPGKCISLPADLAKYDECVRLAKELEKRERVLHILVNNSGVTWGESFHSYPDAAFTKLLTLNVQRVFTLTQQLHPLLEKAHEEDRFIARIINIGSINGVGNPGLETYAYSSSKAALHQLSKHLANRLAPHITVNAIAPGPFRSKMMKHTLDHFEKELAEGLPLKRIGAPEDIASTALWLSGPGGAWVTGTVVPVDGGSLVATSSKL